MDKEATSYPIRDTNSFQGQNVQIGIRIESDIFTSDPVLPVVLDMVPDAILVLNGEREIVFANRAFIRKSGEEDLHSLLGRRLGDAVSCVHSRQEGNVVCGTTNHCLFCGALEAALKGEAGVVSSQECRMTLAENLGSLDLRIWPARITVQGRDYVFLVMKDISDQKRRQVLEKTFFHDVLGTVGAIHGYSEVLKENGVEQLTKVELLDRLSKLTIRLTEEIESHRILAAAEDGTFSIRPALIGSRGLIEDMAELYRGHREAMERSIVIDSSAEEIPFQSDRALIRRVIANMLRNALEASPVGAKIVLGCRSKDNTIEFWVNNAGVIPHDVQMQIFKRSFSTKGEGRGVGTYSMKLLSEKYLGGRIGFRSTSEEGTTFIARYPLILSSKRKTV